MSVVSDEIMLKTKGDVQLIDITGMVQERLDSAGLSDGIVNVFCYGSTGAVSTIEFEPGLEKDIPWMLERIAPKDYDYAHHGTWHDDNGRSHVRATLMGPSLTVPFIKGKMMLGTWQQIVFIELDTRPRDRKLIIQVVGE